MKPPRATNCRARMPIRMARGEGGGGGVAGSSGAGRRHRGVRRPPHPAQGGQRGGGPRLPDAAVGPAPPGDDGDRADRPGAARATERLVESVVTFNRLTDEQIERYVATRRARARPAAMPSTARPPSFVRFLSGSYSGVVGLPLFETAQLLRGHGWQVP